MAEPTKNRTCKATCTNSYCRLFFLLCVLRGSGNKEVTLLAARTFAHVSNFPLHLVGLLAVSSWQSMQSVPSSGVWTVLERPPCHLRGIMCVVGASLGCRDCLVNKLCFLVWFGVCVSVCLSVCLSVLCHPLAAQSLRALPAKTTDPPWNRTVGQVARRS